MSSSSEAEQIQALEKRLEEATKALQELEKAIAKLPQPEITSSAHEHTYDACIDMGLTKYVTLL